MSTAGQSVGSDRIRLCNMQFYGYHGVFAAERELGQRFEVDVELDVDLQAAAKADDLELSINYVEVFTVVKEIVEEREFALLEALAEEIAQTLLDAHDLRQVVVRVRKPSVAMGAVLDHVEIEVVRVPSDRRPLEATL